MTPKKRQPLEAPVVPQIRALSQSVEPIPAVLCKNFHGAMTILLMHNINITLKKICDFSVFLKNLTCKQLNISLDSCIGSPRIEQIYSSSTHVDPCTVKWEMDSGLTPSIWTMRLRTFSNLLKM